MHNLNKILFLLTTLVFAFLLQAQEGGPPMLTDDARVADFKEWELNTSINSSVTNKLILSTPHIDFNYGLLEALQLKAEAPLLLTFNKDGTVDPSIGEIILGVKYKFLDEEKHFISVATFPQYTVNEEKGFFLPVFIEKNFGEFLTGVAIGYFIGESNRRHSELGALFGYKPTENWDLMLEYYTVQSYYDVKGMNGYINTGFRVVLNDCFMIMGSFGSQVLVPREGERERFISWIGLRSLF